MESTLTRVIAALQLMLIVPAALFLTAVLVAAGDTPKYDLARVAQQIVTWYSGRAWTLWVLLLAVPLAVLIGGCATLLAAWNRDVEVPQTTRLSLAMIPAPLATLGVAATTMTSAGILAIVALHMLAH
jgi:hypothetical protein